MYNPTPFERTHTTYMETIKMWHTAGCRALACWIDVHASRAGSALLMGDLGLLYATDHVMTRQAGQSLCSARLDTHLSYQ
jgi:hypothetical protein